jgi:hypothetical protein
MGPQTPRPLEATLKHRSLIPVTLLALLAMGCETAELGPKPVWAGGDAPTLADTSLPDISTGDSVVEPDSTEVTADTDTTPDVSAEDTVVTPETSSDGAITVDADATDDTAPSVDADATDDTITVDADATDDTTTVDADAADDTAPGVDADASEDATPEADAAADAAADAVADTAAADISTDLPSEDLAQADAAGCDPASDPTCAGALAPTWQLENVAQATVGFGDTYGLEAYAGTVTVLALLTGG